MYGVSLSGQYPGIARMDSMARRQSGASEVTVGMVGVMSRLQSSPFLLDRVMVDSCKEYSTV